MKIGEIVTETYAELLPRDDEHNTAQSIAKQMIRAAQYKAGGRADATRKMAQMMADKFHSDVVAAIDDEMQYSQIKSVDDRA